MVPTRSDPERRRRAEELAGRLLAEAGHAGPALAAPVPANDRGPEPLSAARRRRFRTHLLQTLRVAGRAERKRPDEDLVPWRPDYRPATAEEARVLAAGCVACRGHCCETGGDLAWLDDSDLRRRLRARPGVRRRAVLGEYLARLPERAVRASCVFHAKGGCALPREMRSEVCNEHLCPDLLELRRRIERGDRGRPVLVACLGPEPLRGVIP